MPLLNTAQIAQFQTIQASSLHDTCTLRRRNAATTDDYGMPIVGEPIETANVPCGFKPKKVGEVMGNAQVTDIVGELRLAIGTEITGLDEITLTKRYGEALATPQKFKVDGTPIRGASGIVVQLIKATV